MDMNHVRYLGTARVREHGEYTTLLFSRAFLADQFKGYRLRRKDVRTRRRSSAKIKVNENADDWHVVNRSNHLRKFAAKADRPISNDSDLPLLKSSRYYSSVSYALKVLCNDRPTSVSSDSDSSTNALVEELPRVNLNSSNQHYVLGAHIKDNGEIELAHTHSHKADISECDSDSDSDLHEKMRRLGLPTSFGAQPKVFPHGDGYTNTYDTDDPEVDEQLLLHAETRCKSSSPLQTATASSSSCDNLYVPPHSRLKSWSSSDNLLGYHRAVFHSLCYLFELACSFQQANSCNIEDLRLELIPVWRSHDFKLTALLYSCQTYWRYQAPITPLSKITAPRLSLPQLNQLRSDPLLTKYWAQRFRLFSRFNDGVQLDRDGFFSATPEAIAAHQALRIRRALLPDHTCPDNLVVIDACSGVGSNSIQLALVGFQVVAIEIDQFRSNMALHNAKVYGVDSLIEFVCGDFFEWATRKLTERAQGASVASPYAALFMSPPWGGPDYLNETVFDLNSICFGSVGSHDFWHAIQLASQLTSGNLVLFLPRNTNIAQMGVLNRCVRTAGLWTQGTNDWDVEVEVNMINSKTKALTIYTGSLCNTKRPARRPDQLLSTKWSSHDCLNHELTSESFSDSSDYTTASDW